MLKPNTYRNILQVIPFGIIFLASGLLYALVDLIISGDLVNKLDFDPEIQIKLLGENELSGKKKNMMLCTIL